MIKTKEELKEALRICATHDKTQCRKCPYYTWCDADPINPHLNMQQDALDTIQSLENWLWVCRVELKKMHEQLAKAKHDLDRYGRRIREQKDEILDLLAMLDGAIAGQETLQKALAKTDKCVSCGGAIPEGRQVCPNCEKGAEVE